MKDPVIAEILFLAFMVAGFAVAIFAVLVGLCHA